MKRGILLGALASLAVSCAQAQNAGVLAPSPSASAADECPSTYLDSTGLAARCAQLELLGTGYRFTEGPAIDRLGNVFFTDQPNNRIHRWDGTTGEVSTFLTETGRANGMTFDANGFLITASDMHGQIWSIDPAGKHTVIVDGYEGRRLNGPNDIWIAPNGGMYITDALVFRDWWDADDPRREGSQVGGGFVYYLSPDRKTLTRVAGMEFDQTDLRGNRRVQPNGIVGTPDGTKLYVGYIFPRKVHVYDINPDGTLSNSTEFADSHSDGMTIDERGNVYVTTREAGVTAFSPGGERIFNVPTARFWTGSVAFGGPDRKTMFITAADQIFRLQMQVRGVE